MGAVGVLVPCPWHGNAATRVVEARWSGRVERWGVNYGTVVQDPATFEGWRLWCGASLDGTAWEIITMYEEATRSMKVALVLRGVGPKDDTVWLRQRASERGWMEVLDETVDRPLPGGC